MTQVPIQSITDIVTRLADRRVGRTEANVQSDLHMLLALAPFELNDDDIRDIVLEAPAGQRRRIDVELGQAVFEVKRDLRSGNVRGDAVFQLEGYVRSRVDTLQQRYVGVLTDGVEWHLYTLAKGGLDLVSSHEVSATTPDVDALIVWLESVLATGSRITPTPHEIVRRLGAKSPAHELDYVELASLYAANRDHPEVRLKRELWAKLLTTALGTNFEDEDALFVEHTLLVATAEIIAHAVVGLNPADPSIGARSLLEGSLFRQVSQVGGVVEPDFFDWVADVPLGERFVRTLARRLSRFEWGGVEHDVMKVLYESVIGADTRHALGEYYTPDWLADEIVREVVPAPLEQRVLDPACGSGTFVFHAVRHYLETAEQAGLSGPEALAGATRNVLGVDVHPVAVTLARVTYLLAIGMERLGQMDRPPFSVPVYLGDSVQWGQEQTLLTSDGLTVPTDDGALLFVEELKFPERVLQDADIFDRLVSEMSDRATGRAKGSPVPSLAASFRRFAVHPDDRTVLDQTFATMCRLHDTDRNHIWGYYVRNLARPTWLSHIENRVDVLVGNPPWLAYRYMPSSMQIDFRQMTTDRGMWAGASVATNQDLSALFLVRSVELYLREGGRVAFVMPLAALSRRQFAGFRTGLYESPGHHFAIAFDTPWDLHRVKPSFFPVPACVVFGRRASAPLALTAPPETWSGRLPMNNAPRTVAAQCLTRAAGDEKQVLGEGSPYGARFAQGATVVPRVLLIVEEQTAPALGVGAGRVPVRSLRSAKEKKPWKNVPSLAGTLEREFVHPLIVGDSLLPFRVRESVSVVAPWDGKRLLDGGQEQLDNYPGLAEWWRKAEDIWNSLRSSDRLSLLQRLDYRRGLSQQFPAAEHRVVYSASGMYLAAARVSDPRAVIEHKLYWAAASSVAEARYVEAILNTDAVTVRVRPLQARGEHNPRDFDKYVWQLPIPVYDPADERHRELVAWATKAEDLVAGFDVPEGVSFEAVRRRIRAALFESEPGQRMEALVADLLA